MTRNGEVVTLHGKTYSSSEAWVPEGGILFVKFVPDREVHPIAYRPLQLKGSTLQNATALEYMQEFKQALQPVMTYITSPADTEWWTGFWDEQRKICEIIDGGVEEQLEQPWVWRTREAEPVQVADVADTNNETVLEEAVPSQPLEREMYLGPHRSAETQREIAAQLRGDLAEINVGDMVAFEAEGTQPFWIAKVLQVIVDDAGHWWETEHEEAMIGTYASHYIIVETENKESEDDETRPRRRGLRKRPRAPKRVANTDFIEIGDGRTTVLLYGFKLTKHGTLAKTSVHILNRKLFELSRQNGSGLGVVPPPRETDDESQPDATDDEYSIKAPDIEDIGDTEEEGIDSGREDLDVWGQNRFAAERASLLHPSDNA